MDILIVETLIALTGYYLLFIGVKNNITGLMMEPIAMVGVFFSLGGVMMIIIDLFGHGYIGFKLIIVFCFSGLVSIGLLIVFLRFLAKRYSCHLELK